MFTSIEQQFICQHLLVALSFHYALVNLSETEKHAPLDIFYNISSKMIVYSPKSTQYCLFHLACMGSQLKFFWQVLGIPGTQGHSEGGATGAICPRL